MQILLKYFEIFSGSNKAKSNKSVMFCDGIRPGSDLTNLDNDFNYNNTITKKLEKNNTSAGKINRNLPIIDSETNTFIPKSENSLPPTVKVNKSGKISSIWFLTYIFHLFTRYIQKVGLFTYI